MVVSGVSTSTKVENVGLVNTFGKYSTDPSPTHRTTHDLPTDRRPLSTQPQPQRDNFGYPNDRVQETRKDTTPHRPYKKWMAWHRRPQTQLGTLNKGQQMKTFYELGTMPKVGDLVMRTPPTELDDNVYMITSIVGDTYHISKTGHSLHSRHLRSYYSPLGQDTQ